MSYENIDVPAKTRIVPTQCHAVKMLPRNETDMIMETNFRNVKSIVIVKLE